MRAQLLHLSGPQRGRTTTYEARVVHIGSAPECEAVVDAPGVAGKHVQIEFVEEECQFHLRRRDGQTFVNGSEVEEVILQDGDQLELGSGGPMLRFRIYVPLGAVCKPVRRMLADARDVARVSGGAAATQTLTRDLLTQATSRLKVGFPIAVIVGAFLAGWVGGWIGGHPSTLVTREELEALRKEQARLASATDLSQDLDLLRKEQQKQQEELARIAKANANVRHIQRDLSRGVCLIHGIFRLRLQDGSWFETDGEPFECEYTGSGFVATSAGHVVTNRHVVAPWREMPPVMLLVNRGAEPVFMHLTATFPDRAPIVVPVPTIREHPKGLDVAVVQLPTKSLEGLPVLPLRDGTIEGEGQSAYVVGYPTGLSLLLARAEESVLEELQKQSANMTDIIAALAQRRLIVPTITSGSIFNVQEFKVEYTAVTTHGGSGGPVFDGDGQVIAVNFAIMPDFTGANFGVPVRFAKELLP